MSKRRISPRRKTPEYSDESYSPSDDNVLRNLHSGIPPSPSERSSSQESSTSTDELAYRELRDDASDSSDETWTPSLDGEESDEDMDLEDKASVWQEVPIKFDDFTNGFNKVDLDLEYGYKEEVKELRKQILREFNNISSGTVKKTTHLNAGQVIKALYNSELLFSVLGFQNKSLVERKKTNGCEGI